MPAACAARAPEAPSWAVKPPATEAAAVFIQERLSICSSKACILWLLVHRLLAGDFQRNAIDAGGGGDVGRLQIRTAPGEIGRDFGQLDLAQQLALRREDANAALPRSPQIALGVDLEPVGNASALVLGQIGDHLAVGNFAIGA